MEEMTVDNALFRNFDKIVRGQLDPIWHRVGPKTKRLVSDLTTLRLLLKSVFHILLSKLFDLTFSSVCLFGWGSATS